MTPPDSGESSAGARRVPHQAYAGPLLLVGKVVTSPMKKKRLAASARLNSTTVILLMGLTALLSSQSTRQPTLARLAGVLGVWADEWDGWF
jgi:hypothetical protein